MPKNKGKGGKNRRRDPQLSKMCRKVVHAGKRRATLASIRGCKCLCTFLESHPNRDLVLEFRGKNENEEKRELIFREDGQEYAQVLRMLGQGRLEAQCMDGVKRLCHIRGKMRKKVWVNVGDIVLLGLREYQDEKADVILKYMADEARSLKAYGELPDNIRVNDADVFEEYEGDENDDIIEFDDIDEI